MLLLKIHQQLFMKKYLAPLFVAAITIISTQKNYAQETQRPDKLYTMSGIGFAFPVGETADYLKPKFSTSLGLNLGLGNGGLFLYPKVSLHAFSMNELAPDNGYNYALQKSRATTYLLNVALGYRKISGKFAFYGFAGGGGGMVLTPRITVNNGNQIAELDNKSIGMGIIEAGLGTEYNIGGANLFVEAGYMHGFTKIQNRTFATAPISVGIKPNLSKLFYKK